ncbi:MAG: DUF3467 domain-containing protein [Vicinamibacteria bacterium]
MAEEKKASVNFTVVPDETADVQRIYSNFCAIQNSPLDFTLTFCEMLPPNEKQLREAQSSHVVKAPVRARLVVPVQMIPGLIAALQDNFRGYQESFGQTKGPPN